MTFGGLFGISLFPIQLFLLSTSKHSIIHIQIDAHTHTPQHTFNRTQKHGRIYPIGELCKDFFSLSLLPCNCFTIFPWTHFCKFFFFSSLSLFTPSGPHKSRPWKSQSYPFSWGHSKHDKKQKLQEKSKGKNVKWLPFIFQPLERAPFDWRKTHLFFPTLSHTSLIFFHTRFSRQFYRENIQYVLCTERPKGATFVSTHNATFRVD